MDAIALLREADGGAGLQALASRFGLSQEQVEGVVESVTPQILQRIERNSLSRGGVADLVAMLGAAGTGGFSNPDAVGSELGRHQGNALLEQMFGGADKSRAVAAKASYASGIGDSIIKAMLPYIASMVINAIFKRTSGGLGDILSKIPNMGGSAPRAPGGSNDGWGRSRGGGGSIDDILSRIPNIGGTGGATQSQPFPGGGSNPLPGGDDGFRTGGRTDAPSGGPFGGGIPGNMGPGDRGPGGTGQNPYGDLSDVIRRGGSEAQIGGNPLWRIIRNTLGSALGFQSRGVLSWIFRMVILRFGWNILRTVLRRMFSGR